MFVATTTIITETNISPQAAPRLRMKNSRPMVVPEIIAASGIQWICATSCPKFWPRTSIGPENQETHWKPSRVCSSHMHVVTHM